jgi:hypothetical protein
VVDAKFYTSQLSQLTIEKTVDDLNLRCDDAFKAYGLLVCSDETKLDEYKSQTQSSKLYLIKLDKVPQEAFVQKIFHSDPELYASDLLVDYLNEQNL